MRLLSLLFALVLSIAPAAAQFSIDPFGPGQPANLGDLKRVLVQYHDSGRWAAEQARVARNAERWLVTRAGMGNGQKLAAVFDIDETSLLNYPALKRNDFGFILDGPCTPGAKDACGMRAWIRQGRDAAIPGTLALYRRARELGVAVFFITGRDESMRAGTVKNLRAAGYDGWAALVMEPVGARYKSAADFKAPHRAAIEKQGFRIVLNIGDQPSDLAGGHAEMTALLPNPYYRIP
jgi:predicted secreted acid phosphatase